MRPPCERIVQDLLPAFRALVARKLIEEHGFSQTTTAKKLGMTQAAVSHYLHLKRGGKRVKKLESLPIIESAVNKIARSMATKESSGMDPVLTFCKLCNALKKQHSLHTLEENGRSN